MDDTPSLSAPRMAELNPRPEGGLAPFHAELTLPRNPVHMGRNLCTVARGLSVTLSPGMGSRPSVGSTVGSGGITNPMRPTARENTAVTVLSASGVAALAAAATPPVAGGTRWQDGSLSGDESKEVASVDSLDESTVCAPRWAVATTGVAKLA